MRAILLLVLSGLLFTASCSGALSQTQPECAPPKSGQVLAACNGSVVISLGSGDAVRPGDTFSIVRGGQRVTGIVIHEVKGTQSVGTTIGGSSNGDALPGDTAVED